MIRKPECPACNCSRDKPHSWCWITTRKSPKKGLRRIKCDNPVDAVAFVNWQRLEQNETAILAIAYEH